MKSIAITGANGFIGKELCAYFHSKGYRVYALQRNENQIHTKGIEYVKFDLQNPENIHLLNVDYLIHAAYFPYRKGNNSFEININGTKALLNECRKNQIKFVHVSSLSAQENALSMYGKTKFDLEKLFNPSSDLILVPGLVIGKGGLFFSIYSFIHRFPLVPIFQQGKQTTYIVSIQNLCESTEYLINNNFSGKKYLLHPEAVSLKQLYQSIASYSKNKIFFISIPAFLAEILFTILDFLPLKLSIGKENYLGIKQKILLNTETDFLLKNYTFSSLRKSIEELDK